MATNRLNLVYAIKDGAGISIEDVESGLKCGCVCPACGEPLVAKKGTQVMHHFAHHSGSNCEYGYETSLHLMAKAILSTAKTIVTPKVYVYFPNSAKEKQLCCDSREIPVDKVELEQNYGNVVPDVVVHSGRRKFFLEIYVTHAVDKDKISKLKTADISTMEIDLRKVERTISYMDLQRILLEDNEQKRWIYNSVADKKLRKCYAFSERIPLVIHGFAIHTKYCPIKSRIWHGKSYANFIDDCTGCPYQILYHTTEDESLQGEILCSGRYKIATLQDLARVTSRTKQFGDVEVSISRDRKGEFEPQLPKKNQTSVSQDIEKKFCPCTQKK